MSNSLQLQPEPEFKLLEPVPTTPEISLILPAYNESLRQENGYAPGDAFRNALDTYSNFLEQFDRSELVVVDDGSTKEDNDNTIAIAEAHGARVLVNPDGANSIRGGALKIGFRETSGDTRLYTDADGSYRPDTLSALFELASDGFNDVAVAYRADNDNQHSGLIRRVGHDIIHRICEHPKMAPTGVKDPQAGAKAFSARAAETIWPQVMSNDWTADREALVIARELGYEIAQVAAEIESHDDSTVRVVPDTIGMLHDSLQVGLQRDVHRNRYAGRAALQVLKGSRNLANRIF
jgi:dolichyl-phosphate beta-glucosyltransferase